MNAQVDQFLNNIGQAIAATSEIDFNEVNTTLDIVATQLSQDDDEFIRDILSVYQSLMNINLNQLETLRLKLMQIL